MSYLCAVIRKRDKASKKNFFGGRNFVRPPKNRILSTDDLKTYCSNHNLQQVGKKHERIDMTKEKHQAKR